MGYVLITNIGNRNITNKGKTYSIQDKLSFKEWSLQLLENYENQKDFLDINIFNPLIEEDRPSQIVIFYSDQEEYQTKTEQDTLYEAQIIKNILVDKYNYSPDQIDLLKINAVVIDNGGLLKYYRGAIRQLRKRFPQLKFVVCDAGGTAQQKMALKVILEYLLEPEGYEIKYVQGNELVSDVNINEYRKVINNELATRYVKTGDYLVAADLIGIDQLNNAHNSKSHLLRYFAFTYYRFINNQKLAKANAERLMKQEETAKIFLNEKNIFPGLGIEKENELINLYLKSLFYFNSAKYSLSILTFSQFYERLFSYYIDYRFDPVKYGKISFQNEDQEKELHMLFYDGPLTVYWKRAFEKQGEYARVNIRDLSTQCVLMLVDEGIYKKIGLLLSPHIEYSFNVSQGKIISRVRNKIAHEGLEVTANAISSKLQYFGKLIQEIGKVIDLHEDEFSKMNNRLVALIRHEV